MFKNKITIKKVVPIICKTDGLEYEEYRLYDECYETDFLLYVISLLIKE